MSRPGDNEHVGPATCTDPRTALLRRDRLRSDQLVEAIALCLFNLGGDGALHEAGGLGRDALALVLQRPKRSTSFVSVVNADGAEPELKQAIAHWNDARNEMRRAAERAKAAERKRLADAAENSVEFKPQK